MRRTVHCMLALLLLAAVCPLLKDARLEGG